MNWGRYAFDEMDRREQNERLRAAGLITPAEYRAAMRAIDEEQP